MYEDIIANLCFKDVDYDFEIQRLNIENLKGGHFYTADEGYFIQDTECQMQNVEKYFSVMIQEN